MSEADQIAAGPAWAPPSAQVTGPSPGGGGAGRAASAAGSPASAASNGAHGGFRQRPIPLRPMNVLELIDGAVGSVPTLPKALMVRAAVVGGACTAGALALTWWFNRMIGSTVRAHASWTVTDYFGNSTYVYAPSTGEQWCIVTTEILIAVLCSGFAATVLAGMFAPAVKAYVDAEPADAAAVKALLRGRTMRLYGLALLNAWPRAVLVLLMGLLTYYAAVNPEAKVSGWYFLIWLGLGPLCFFTKARTAVAAPAAALEGATLFGSLRRSRRLTVRGVWRTGWASLLTLAILGCATVSLDIFAGEVRSQYGVGDQFAGTPGSPGFSWWLVLYALIYAVTLLATTPFRAATATLLYVDRRFRREGLDIRIGWARLANANAAGQAGPAGPQGGGR